VTMPNADVMTTDGILLVDKPRGISSARAVAAAKRALGGPKIGHLGTLDPLASGLLPLCVGQGTKVAPYLNVADKAYRGVVRLGVVTDTLDVTGEVLSEAVAPDPATLDLAALAEAFTGAIEQVPPAFSAIKRGGVRMYELARRGEAPALEPRAVVIRRLHLCRLGPDRLAIELDCSKGTYVRSLARDLGERIGCGATLEELVRTRFGPFDLGAALALADLETGGPDRARSALVPIDAALAHLRPIDVDRVTAIRLRDGQQQVLERLDRPKGSGEKARVRAPETGLVAVVVEAGGRWRLDRVFRC